MLEFKAFGMKIRFCFGFFAALMLYLYAGRYHTADIFAATCCCLLHELGHLTAMFAADCPPRAVSFYAGGISISPGKTALANRTTQTIILSAGCAVNFFLAAISHMLGMESLSDINLALGIFNMLPYRCFDGGRIISLYLGDKTADALSLITLAAAAAAVAFLRTEPLTLLIFIFAAAAGRLLELER